MSASASRREMHGMQTKAVGEKREMTAARLAGIRGKVKSRLVEAILLWGAKPKAADSKAAGPPCSIEKQPSDTLSAALKPAELCTIAAAIEAALFKLAGFALTPLYKSKARALIYNLGDKQVKEMTAPFARQICC